MKPCCRARVSQGYRYTWQATIVGIAPAALSLISTGEVYTPLTIDPAKELRLNHVLLAFERLKNGVSPQQAQAEMDSISAHMDQVHPELRDWGIRLFTMQETFVSPDLSTGLFVLLYAVTFALLIAVRTSQIFCCRGPLRANKRSQCAGPRAKAGPA